MVSFHRWKRHETLRTIDWEEVGLIISFTIHHEAAISPDTLATEPAKSSPSFTGKTRVQQHKMVYDALQGRMGNELHALALQTSAPSND